MTMTNVTRVKLDAFLPVLNAKVIAVPRSVALQQLRLSINEFCKDSMYWVEELENITPDPSVGLDHTLPLPTGVKPLGDLRINYTTTEEPVPSDLFWLRDPYTVIFDASLVEELSWSIAVNLTSVGSEVPQTLLDYFGESIAAGAAKRLVVMPGRAWSDPAMGQYHEAEFREGKSQAGREVRERFDSYNTQARIDRRTTFY